MKKKKRRYQVPVVKMSIKINYVEPILFGYMFCMFVSIPTEQQLIYHKLCASYFNQTYCQNIYNSLDKKYENDQNMIQKKTAQWSIYMNIARTFPAVISTLLYGVWSDRFGRKFVMLLPIIGDLIFGISQMLNAHFFFAPVSYMLIGAVITALFGNFAAMLSATFSYMADMSDKSSRTKRMVILESMVYLGSVVSNICGGWLLQESGFVAVYALIVAGYIPQIIYWFFLRESRNDLPKNEKSLVNILSVTAIKESVSVIFKKRRQRFRMSLLLLLCCFILLVLFFVAVNSVAILYVQHQPLNFPPSRIGYFLAEINGIKFIGAVFVNFVLIHRYKWSDYSVILLASVMYCGFALSIGFSKQDWQVYLGVLWCLGLGTGTSTTRAGLSKTVSAKEQGKLFSVLSSVEVIVALIGSTGFAEVYKTTLDITPSFSFYLLACLTVLPITLSVILRLFGQKTSYEPLEEDKESENDEGIERTEDNSKIN